MSTNEPRKNRFRFLYRLYEHAGGSAAFDPARGRDMREIGKEIGLSEAETESVVQYLTDEKLVTWYADEGLLGISHRGVKEVETALNAPDQTTHHFPAGIGATVNIIHVDQMSHSTIQQASPGATQGVSLSRHQQASVAAERSVQPEELIERGSTMGKNISDLDAAILQFLSEHPRGPGRRMPDFRDIQKGTGRDELTIHAALVPLQDKGLVKNLRRDLELGVYEMTSTGTVALRLFYSGSGNDPARIQNVLNVEGSTNVVVQQGSPGAVQAVTISPQQKAELVKALREFEPELEKSNLPAEARAEARAEVATLLVELSAPKPKPVVLRECWKSLRAILEGAAAGALTVGLLAVLANLKTLFALVGVS